jgi:hypothetical protein
MSSQIRSRIVIVTIIVSLGVSTRAITDWVSPEALGDVAVSFNDRVQLFDNADPSSNPEVVDVLGVNGGLAFDASLNLFVTNSNIAPALGEPVHKVVITGASALQTPFVQTQANPRSIVFAGDGTFYVASPGNPATIRRYKQTAGYPNPKAFALDATFANIPTDSTACIGIDLHPDQRTLYYVSGGRTIRTATGVDTATGSGNNSPTFGTLPNTLPNPGTACGLRLLAPRDVRETLPATSLSTGGILVADGRNIKRVDLVTGLVIGAAFNAGSGQDSQKQWIDVALDPNTADFWGVEAGFWQLAKFRINSPASVLSLTQLAYQPRGVAVNGELRAAQTTRILSLPTVSTATFLEKPFEHAWKATAPVPVSLAVQTYEVKYSATILPPEECPISLDIRCRLQKFDDDAGNPLATPKTYSRDRSVVYREILLSNPSNSDDWTISFVFPANNTDQNHAGVPCVPGNDPERSSGVLRDPYPHDFFSIDPSLGFYGGDDVIPIKSRGNDSIVVDRDDGQFNMRIIKPVAGTVGQLGSSLPIAVEVTNPTPTGCTDAPGLETKLLLSVVDISVVNGVPVDTVVGDSKGILGGTPLVGNGGIFAKTANQYRTNLDLTRGRFEKNHRYRLCVSALAAETPEMQAQLGIQPPPAGEVCQDITAK